VTFLAVAGVAFVAGVVGILVGYYFASKSFRDWLDRR